MEQEDIWKILQANRIRGDFAEIPGHRRSNYAAPVLTSVELLTGYDKSKIKVSNELINKYCHTTHKEKFVARVFIDFMMMVFNDIIENNIQFIYKFGSKYTTIQMEEMPIEFAKSQIDNGITCGWNPISDNDKAYWIVVKNFGSIDGKKKWVRFGKYMHKHIVDLMNQGKTW